MAEEKEIQMALALVGLMVMALATEWERGMVVAMERCARGGMRSQLLHPQSPKFGALGGEAILGRMAQGLAPDDFQRYQKRMGG